MKKNILIKNNFIQNNIKKKKVKLKYLSTIKNLKIASKNLNKKNNFFNIF